jgi:hypothetical protein
MSTDETFPNAPKGTGMPETGNTVSGAGAADQAAPVPSGSLPGLAGLEYVLECTYGHYPWDDWERAALAAGLDKDLAGLGRLVMREAFQHLWDERLQSLCGWRDQGQEMIKRALRAPRKMRQQWDILLRTDGLQGDYRPRTTDWIGGYLRRDALRLLYALNF